MLVSLFFLTLIYFPLYNGERIPMIADSDVYHTLFGDIASMQDLFIKESDDLHLTRRDSGPADDNETLDELDLELPNIFEFDRANLTNHTFDILDFLDVEDQYNNFTKEHKESMTRKPIPKMNNQTRNDSNKTRRSYDDPDDYAHGESIEWLKKNQLIMVLAQFALHCRYEVGKALLHRDLVRHDKRYKLGYLFNRMRRLKTEQLKQVGAAWRQNWNHENAEVWAMMRFYERVVHFDVDMRDTANLIKAVYSKDEPYDFFEVKNSRAGVDEIAKQKFQNRTSLRTLSFP